ncbi:EF-hand domain-containing protein [Pseudoalteromonas sp. J010]|uniref:EF-hand domain-containing protein n=1 Tax=Pseudoalteromonas sp. J010 TaxID=998465 RepID=UPI000F64EABA|nr:EF-hand domain-containing protein [Pseudoalteromonas sp. J010]RRS08225.1 EF-hand domain-containing protein [Pseudoalteromonas sp. J010]
MNNSIRNIAISAAVLTTLTLSAQVEARKSDRNHKKAPEIVFSKLDLDQSGTLILDELQGNEQTKAEKKLVRADLDGNASIDLTEYLSKQRHSHDLSTYATEIVQCVQALKDADEASLIVVPSSDKFASPEEKFAQLDSDDSGAISVDEIAQTLATRQEIRFAEMDSDNSNDVTLEEFIQNGERKQATRAAVKECIDSLVDVTEVI